MSRLKCKARPVASHRSIQKQREITTKNIHLAPVCFLPFFQDNKLLEISDQQTGSLMGYAEHLSNFIGYCKKLNESTMKLLGVIGVDCRPVLVLKSLPCDADMLRPEHFSFAGAPGVYSGNCRIFVFHRRAIVNNDPMHA